MTACRDGLVGWVEEFQVDGVVAWPEVAAVVAGHRAGIDEREDCFALVRPGRYVREVVEDSSGPWTSELALSELHRLTDLANEFNRRQLRVEPSLDEAELEGLLTAALQERLGVADQMHEAGIKIAGQTQSPAPRDYLLILHLPPPGFRTTWGLRYVTRPSADPVVRVRIEKVSEVDDSAFQRLFDFEDMGINGMSADARILLAEILGYDRDVVALPPADVS